MKILFAASEGLPFSKTGGLADVVGALPKTLAALGHSVTVVLPKYRATKAPQAQKVIESLTVPLGAEMRFPGIYEVANVDGVHYYFVDDAALFDREQLYGTPESGDYPDNALRFGTFAKAVVELLKRVGVPDVIHCHDWQVGLVPVLLRTVYKDDPTFRGVPCVFTIHNLGYQGLFPQETLWTLGLPSTLFQMDGVEFYGHVDFLKGGLVYSDAITTVSRKYAQEIQTAEYGHGLDGLLRARSSVLSGILNGVDYAAWSPESDKFLAANYSSDNLGPKKTAKKDLLAQFKLPTSNLRRPVIGIVSRFAAQKGFDLIEEIAEPLMELDLYIVALGTGEERYEDLFRNLHTRFPEKFGVKVAYDNTLAHKIEGGSDMFLMPSRYEPCGLNQIYSLKYGTVPVVRATGGLDDTIEQYEPLTGRGTGFKFSAYSGAALLECIKQALKVYQDEKAWQQLMRNGMQKDHSWKASALEYLKIYEQVAQKSKSAATS